MVKLALYEWRVLIAIIRLTYGYNRKMDQISIRKISKLTNIDPSSVHKAVRSLEARKMIAVVMYENHLTLGVQKDYQKWGVGPPANVGPGTNTLLVDGPTPLLVDGPTPPLVDGPTPPPLKLPKNYCDNGLLGYASNMPKDSIKDKYKDSIKDNKERGGEKPTPSLRAPVKKFKKPSLQEVTAYCQERKNTINPQMFVDYYTSNGWMVGRTRMRDWKAAVRTWEQRERRTNNGHANSTAALTGSETYRDEEGVLRDAGGYPIDVEITE